MKAKQGCKASIHTAYIMQHTNFTKHSFRYFSILWLIFPRLQKHLVRFLTGFLYIDSVFLKFFQLLQISTEIYF